ncbi:predicted protein [Pyrenophora tritici-repentis Pt-1C-BFP]|uniref:Uncharacterized protein n=1 Tax=Pyrenophora tritici-repentis (strain Pt-1C-BFP) TaxID=426418 RepID=B2W701_PYRTR|nr:uncharacterized protein PTRG_05589 [Pyrenophora tritici-repentis Pt-1C-BFP]EDU48509.1 predicted protein [Pyrenophora tritici-repentis Pt-1C-BFP]
MLQLPSRPPLAAILLASEQAHEDSPQDSPGTVDLHARRPVVGSRPGPLSEAVPKALLRRRSVDVAAWEAWADRSAKALLRVVRIVTLNHLRLSSALPLQGTERRARLEWDVGF